MSYEKVKLHLEEVISRLGMAVQPVLPSGRNPAFAYTVGLHAKGLPELLIFGLPYDMAGGVLFALGQYLEAEKAAGRPIGPGLVQPEGFPTATALLDVSVPAARDYATHADDRSKGKATYLQAIWPDQAGIFPWQPGYDGKYSAQQPVIGTPLKTGPASGLLH